MFTSNTSILILLLTVQGRVQSSQVVAWLGMTSYNQKEIARTCCEFSESESINERLQSVI